MRLNFKLDRGMLRSRRFLVLLLIIIIAVSIGSYLVYRQFIINNRETIPIGEKYVEKVGYYNDNWSLLLKNNTVDNVIARHALPVASSLLPKASMILNKARSMGFNGNPVINFLNRSIQWYKLLEEKHASTYSKIIAADYLYTYTIASNITLLTGNTTLLNRYLSKLRSKAVDMKKLEPVIRHELDLIYGNISVFYNMHYMDIPALYEEILNCLKNLGNIPAITANTQNPKSSQYLSWIYTRLVYYGCSAYYIEYVYPVLYNITFNKILTKSNIEKYSCNFTISYYEERIEELNNLLKKVASNINGQLASVTSNKTKDVFIEGLISYTRFLAEKNYTADHLVFHSFYNLVSLVVLASSMNKSLNILINYYESSNCKQAVPSNNEIKKLYNELLTTMNKTITNAIKRYDDNLLLSIIYLNSVDRSPYNYLKEYLKKTSNPASDDKAKLYSYYTSRILLDYYQNITSFLESQLPHC